ncbi:MAG TPA: M23 family metallopeptidase [Longimicrobium sp.]|nr:M23 family metallopeptidase [Longimicrobium sp.]
MTPHDRRARAHVRSAGSAAVLSLLLLGACAPRGVEPASRRPAPRLLGVPAAEAATPRSERPTIFLSSNRGNANDVEVDDVAIAPGASLLIPVRGIRAEQLSDSYDDARDGGSRTHHAIDIMAPRGTPVLAAADGTVRKLRTGGNGGITIYQLGTDGRTLYYYAHLQRYAAGLVEGLPVVAGQVIAYVGDTGNAGAGNYHLHFSVGRLSDPSRYWDSQNINPYPLLAGYAARRAASR